MWISASEVTFSGVTTEAAAAAASWNVDCKEISESSEAVGSGLLVTGVVGAGTLVLAGVVVAVVAVTAGSSIARAANGFGTLNSVCWLRSVDNVKLEVVAGEVEWSDVTETTLDEEETGVGIGMVERGISDDSKSSSVTGAESGCTMATSMKRATSFMMSSSKQYTTGSSGSELNVMIDE